MEGSNEHGKKGHVSVCLFSRSSFSLPGSFPGPSLFADMLASLLAIPGNTHREKRARAGEIEREYRESIERV